MKIDVRTAAREDILRQYRFYLIERDATLTAERFLDAVQSAIDTVGRTPNIGAPKILPNSTLAGLRTWPVRGFPSMRIYYIHAESDLTIVRVLHGKRDINPLLEEENELDKF